jgi:chromatin remodeling complex protein RSC6
MRDEIITCHIESSLKRDIRELADESDQSVSEFIRDLLKEEVAKQKRHDVVRETKAADKIERVIAEGKDEIRQEIKEFNKTAKAVQSLTARAGVYSVRNWELVKQDHSQTMQNDARSTAARRLQKDILEDLDLDLEDEIEEIEEESRSNRPDGWGEE